jgi:argininosuccinate synthase
MDYEQFGNFWVKADSIIAVMVVYNKEYSTSVTGLTVMADSEKPKEVSIVFNQGSILTFDGEEAKEFAEWWAHINRTVGEIS